MNFEELVVSLRVLDVQNLSYEQLQKIEGPLKNKLYLVRQFMKLHEKREDKDEN